jgi:hypothetical protein
MQSKAASGQKHKTLSEKVQRAGGITQVVEGPQKKKNKKPIGVVEFVFLNINCI